MTPSPSAVPVRVPALRLALCATAVGGAGCAVAATLAAGTSGLLSAVLGAAVVVAFFAAGLVPLRVADAAPVGASVGLGILLLTYTLRLAVAVAVLRLAARAEVLDERWVGATVLVCAVIWCGGLFVGWVRAGRSQ